MADLTTDELEDEIRAHFNRMRGKLAGLIESFGLPDKQERGCVTTMKSLSYEAENSLVDLLKQ